MKTRNLGSLHSIGTHREFSQTKRWRRNLRGWQLWGILSMAFLVMNGLPWSIPIAVAAVVNECVIDLNNNTQTCQGATVNGTVTDRLDRHGSPVDVKLVKQESLEDAVMASLTRRISVNLAVPFQPEELLASKAEVQAQWDEIARVQEQFISELWQAYQASHGVAVNNTVATPPLSTQEEFMWFFDITPLRGLPVLVMQINDFAILDEIVQHPLVAGIEVDSFPLSEESVAAEDASTSADDSGDEQHSRASSTRAIELPKTVLLEVAKAGTGTGSIRSDDGLINCGTSCRASYLRNRPVTLTASPATGSTFTAWSGQCSGSNAITHVSMDAAKKCVATFTLVPMSISGSVWKDLNGDGVRQTDEPPADAVKVFLKGPEVPKADEESTAATGVKTLTRSDVPELSTLTDSNGNYKFANLTRTGNYSLSVVTDENWALTFPVAQTYAVSLTPGQAVTKKDFGIVPPVTLTVTITGNGEVISSDKLIQCGTSCQATYRFGTKVTLMAKAAEGSLFKNWEGACEDVTDTTCEVVMTQSLMIGANYVPGYTLQVNVVWPGGGNIGISSSSVGGQGSACTNMGGNWLICRIYAVTNPPIVVNLIHIPNNGYTFIKWLDDCAPFSSQCKVRMDRSRTARACMAKNSIPPECK